MVLFVGVSLSAFGGYMFYCEFRVGCVVLYTFTLHLLFELWLGCVACVSLFGMIV